MKNRSRSLENNIGLGHQMAVKGPRSVFGVRCVGVMRADIF